MSNFLNKIRSSCTAIKRAVFPKTHENDDLFRSNELEVLNGVRLEGYLFKKTTSPFNIWNRRWFAIHSGQLIYRKTKGQKIVTVKLALDLKLYSVRPLNDTNRPNCFELFSTEKSHILQADSENGCRVWIQAIQNEIAAQSIEIIPIQINPKSGDSNLHKQTTKNKTLENILSVAENNRNCDCKDEIKPQSIEVIPIQIKPKLDDSNSHKMRKFTTNKTLEDILAVPGNNRCCDCSAKNPDWASVNLGITLCKACSDVHCGLGMLVSKVRPLKLDEWFDEVVLVMLSLGNTAVNSIYEGHIDAATGLTRPQPDSSHQIRDAWIKAKYVNKLFINSRWSGAGHVDLALCKAAETGFIGLMARALALDGDRNFPSNNRGRSPIHLAVLNGSITALQYLLLNDVKINNRDCAGKTALLLATELGLTSQAALLLANGADQMIADHHGNTPFNIAVKTSQEIAILLEMSRLTDDLSETEYGKASKEILQSVVHDFLRP